MNRIPGVNYNLIEVGTHLPLLIRAFEMSEGDVLELGAGIFSTTVLRWLCEMSGRTLYTYEGRNHWYKKVSKNPVPYHKTFLCSDWEKIDIDRHWGLVFIDQDPSRSRAISVQRLAKLADYIVIHDTEPNLDRSYRFSSIWPLFKYRYDYNKLKPNTSIVSNFHDLKEFKENKMRNFSFFYAKGGSGYQRGEQKANYFGGKKNPASGFEDDICIYVKITPPEDHPKHTYYDVDDNPDALEYLKRHPDVGVIAISPGAKEYMEGVLERHDIVCIPHDHCNYERDIRPDRPVKYVGIIGSPSSFQYPADDFRRQLKKVGLELKYEADYWDAYKTRPDREMRLNVAEFYKSMDIQVIWRPKNWRPARFQPFRNPNKLGNSCAFGIPTVAYPEENFIKEFDGCFIGVQSIPEMVAECKKLKENKDYYRYYALKGLAKAEEYHIDNLSKQYLSLK